MEEKVLVFGQPLKRLPDLYVPTEALRVLLEAFEGPLDILLYLIKKQNIDIKNISIASITEQYLHYIQVMREQAISLSAEYLLMAATLADIKAKMLLPRAVLEEDADETVEQDLLARLSAYAQLKASAEKLAALPFIYEEIGLSGHLLPVGVKRVVQKPPNPMAELSQAVARLRHLQRLRQAHIVEKQTMRLADKVALISQRINAQTQWTVLSSFYQAEEGREGQALSLAALLELDRARVLEWRQEVAFAPVELRAVGNERTD